MLILKYFKKKYLENKTLKQISHKYRKCNVKFKERKILLRSY